MAYIDDILIFSPSWDAHVVHLRQLPDALRNARLTVNLKKSKLGQQTVQYLGVCTGCGKIRAVLDKVAALQDVPLPPTKKDLQQF